MEETGRVTRQMRKRIASVDQDNSSRPGTPVNKLQTNEPDRPETPSRPVRMTRRNSVSEVATPSKTPAKTRGAAGLLQSQLGTPDVGSPARRTRRRSTSISEAPLEEKVPPRKSVSKPNFDTLEEEEETNIMETRRVTRLQSKSPLQSNSPPNKPSRASKSPSMAKSPIPQKSPTPAKSPLTTATKTPITTSAKSPESTKSSAPTKSPTPSKTPKTPKVLLSKSLASSDSPIPSASQSPVPSKSPTPSESSSASKSQKRTTPKPGPLSSKRKSLNQPSVDGGEDDIKVVIVDSEDETILEVPDDEPKPAENEPKVEVHDGESKFCENEPNGGDSVVKAHEDESKLHESNGESPVVEMHDNGSVLQEGKQEDQLPTETVDTEVQLSNITSPNSKATLEKKDQSVVEVDAESPVRNKELGRSAVQFKDSPEMEKTRASYPKTPALIKSKSYIESTKGSDDEEEDESFHSPKISHDEVVVPETQIGDDEFYDSMDLQSGEEKIQEQSKAEETEEKMKENTEDAPAAVNYDSKTPHRRSVTRGSLSSSTPLVQTRIIPNTLTGREPAEQGASNQAESNSITRDDEKLPKQETVKSSDPEPVTEEIMDDANTSKDEKLNSRTNSLGWGHSVRGSGKIDAIDTASNKDNAQQPETIESKEIIEENPPKRKSLNIVDDDEDEEEDEKEEDEDEELAEDEKPYKRNRFVADEAMEVDEDYRSGDSMDEEERREMEENEIPVDGESLGSEDTDQEDNHEDDEDDDGSFIVADGSDDDEPMLLEYSDDDEHLQDKKPGSYKRILVQESDSDDEKDKEEQQKEEEASLKQAADSTGDDHDGSKLSDAASRLHNLGDEDAEEAAESLETLNASRQRFLNKLNKSDRFNKTVQELDVTQAEGETTTETNESNTNKSANEVAVESGEDVESENDRKSLNRSKTCETSHNTSTTGRERRSLNASRSNAKTDEQDDTEEANVSISKNKKRKSLNQSHMAEESNDDEDNAKDVSISLKNKSLNASKIATNHEEEEEQIDQEDNDAEDDESESEEDGDAATNKSMNRSVAFNLGENGSDTESNESEEDEQAVEESSKPQRKAKSALSASFSHAIKQKRRDSLLQTAMHNSFSIGCEKITRKLRPLPKQKDLAAAEDRKNEDEEDMEAFEMEEENVEAEQEEAEDESVSSANSSASANDEKDMERTEVEKELERLKSIEVVSRYLANERRKTLQLPVKMGVGEEEDSPKLKSKRRKSMASGAFDDDFNPSQSMVETIAEHKRLKQEESSKVKRKRLSKSFSGALGGDGDADLGLNDTAFDEVRHMHKKSKVSKEESIRLDSSTPGQPKSKGAVAPSNASNDDNNNKVQQILNRCDQILERANLAKLEAKRSNQQRKVLLPRKKKNKKKKMSAFRKRQQAQSTSTDSEHSEPAPVTASSTAADVAAKEEEKRQAVTRALEVAARILTGKKDSKCHQQVVPATESPEEEAPQAKLKVESKKVSSHKSLAADTTKKKKNDKIAMSPESQRKPTQQLTALPEHLRLSDQENYMSAEEPPAKRQRANVVVKSAAGVVVEMPLTPHKPKKAKIRKLPTSSGVMCEEPLTPRKAESTEKGIRVTPNTPKTVGFKVRQLLSPPDKAVPHYEGNRKRKRRNGIEEPQRTLPLPKWSSSGVFLEGSPVVEHATNSTNFMMVGLMPFNTVNSNALNFKDAQLASSRIPRESSRAVQQRRERGYINSRF